MKPRRSRYSISAGPLACVGDSGGLQRLEIDHPPESASADVAIRVVRRERDSIERSPARPPRGSSSRARRELRRVRRLADAGVLRGHRRRAHRHPHDGRPVRRQSPGQGAGARPGRSRVRQLRAHQRSAPHRTGQGAIHVVLQRIRRRDRRPDRLLRLRRRDLPGAQRRQHRRRRRRVAGPRTRRANHHRRAPVVRCAGGAGPEVGRGRRRAGAADRHGLHGIRGRRVRRRPGAGVPHRLHRRTGLRAAAAVGSGARSCSTPWSTRSAAAGGEPAASARATPCAPRWATRCTATSCRWTSHRCRRAAAGRSGGRRTRSGAARRCWRRRRPGRGGLLRGLRAIGRGVLRGDLTVLDGDTAGRGHHVGNLLSDTESRHRPGVDRHRRRHRRRRSGSRSTSAARRSSARSSSRRSSNRARKTR